MTRAKSHEMVFKTMAPRPFRKLFVIKNHLTGVKAVSMLNTVMKNLITISVLEEREEDTRV